jgi:hypothetical protein
MSSLLKAIVLECEDNVEILFQKGFDTSPSNGSSIGDAHYKSRLVCSHDAVKGEINNAAKGIESTPFAPRHPSAPFFRKRAGLKMSIEFKFS